MYTTCVRENQPQNGLIYKVQDSSILGETFGDSFTLNQCKTGFAGRPSQIPRIWSGWTFQKADRKFFHDLLLGKKVGKTT